MTIRLGTAETEMVWKTPHCMQVMEWAMKGFAIGSEATII